MKKNFAVIGLGVFGLSLLQELVKFTDNIIAIDIDESQVKEASLIVNQCFIMDSTDEKQLLSIGMDSVDHAVICFGGNLESIILTLVSLKNIGIKNITVRCDQDNYLPILNKLGATDIISPQKVAGIRLANRLISESFTDYFEMTSDYCIVEVLVPSTMKTVRVIDLDTRNRFDVNIMLINRDNKSFAPRANDEIRANDKLFVLGKKTQIVKFTNSFLVD